MIQVSDVVGVSRDVHTDVSKVRVGLCRRRGIVVVTLVGIERGLRRSSTLEVTVMDLRRGKQLLPEPPT
jgi:hypothetical protein